MGNLGFGKNTYSSSKGSSSKRENEVLQAMTTIISPLHQFIMLQLFSLGGYQYKGNIRREKDTRPRTEVLQMVTSIPPSSVNNVAIN